MLARAKLPAAAACRPQAEVTRDFARVLVAVEADGGSDSSSNGDIIRTIIAGHATGWLVAGELQVLEVAVHPGHQGRGVGAALLRALLAECG